MSRKNEDIATLKQLLILTIALGGKPMTFNRLMERMVRIIKYELGQLIDEGVIRKEKQDGKTIYRIKK